MAKQEPKPGTRNTVKGLNKLILTTTGAAAKQAQAVQKALNKAGMNHFHVVVPGQKNPTGPKPRVNRNVSKGKHSPE